MNPIESMKMVAMVPPEGKDNGDYTTNNYVDTQGFDRLTVAILTGNLAAAVGSTAEGNAIKVEECDTSGGSYTDVSGAALADAIAADEDDQIHVIDIDLRKSHKRYMRLNAPHSGDGSGTASDLAVIGILSKGEGNLPNDAASRGADEWVSA